MTDERLATLCAAHPGPYGLHTYHCETRTGHHAALGTYSAVGTPERPLALDVEIALLNAVPGLLARIAAAMRVLVIADRLTGDDTVDNDELVEALDAYEDETGTRIGPSRLREGEHAD